MDPPTVSTEGDTLILDWPGGIRAEADEIHRDSAGLHAFLTWFQPGADNPLLAPPSGINLTSASTRKSMAKYMEEKTELDIEWLKMIEQLTAFAFMREREGQPFVKVGGEGKIPPRVYRIEKLMEEKQLTWFYGEGESGKTTLADAMALTVQGWLMPLGLRGEFGEVLVLDWETDENEHNRRIRMIAKGQTVIDVPEVHYREMAAPLVRDARIIKRYIEKNNIALVIIDSVGMAMGTGARGEGDPIMPMVAAMREWNVTVACLDHLSKSDSSDAGPKRKPINSIYKWNIARSAFEVRAHAEEEKNYIDIALYHRKSNNGKHWHSMGWQVTFGEEATYFKPKDMMSVPELAAGATQKEQIKAVLRGGSQFQPVIADRTGIPDNQVRAILSRYKTDFVKDGERWGLPYE